MWYSFPFFCLIRWGEGGGRGDSGPHPYFNSNYKSYIMTMRPRKIVRSKKSPLTSTIRSDEVI